MSKTITSHMLESDFDDAVEMRTFSDDKDPLDLHISSVTNSLNALALDNVTPPNEVVEGTAQSGSKHTPDFKEEAYSIQSPVNVHMSSTHDHISPGISPYISGITSAHVDDVAKDQSSISADAFGEKTVVQQQELGDASITAGTPYSACFRCGLRVYPVEKVDIGLLFHRRCFRCKVCNIQLTMKTFCLDRENKSEIFCRVHTPRFVGTIDEESVGIKTALNTPRRQGATNDQIRGSGGPGWQYDPRNALDYDRQRGLREHTRQRDHAGTYKKFEELGVFDAQSELEKVQKEEEDRLYQLIRDERSKEIRRVESELGLERREVGEEGGELDMTTSDTEADVTRGEETDEEMCQERERRIERLIRRMSVEEKQKVSDLIEKQSQEMLVMIAEKLAATEDATGLGTHAGVSEVTLSTVPSVDPPETKRRSLFNSPRVFEDIDRHVCQIAQNDYTTFTSLVRDLIRDCLTDLEKARAIFLWITLKDLNSLEISDTAEADSPYGILRGIQYGSESYHHLFKRLCSYAGLFCEVIQGHSKAAGYKPGMDAIKSQFRNSWTAVYIDGSWQFINCNWGARHVKGQSDATTFSTNDDVSVHDSLHYRFDEFYFITDPEDHIFQHFPDSPAWQLLECPITAKDFIDLPVVKSPFFNLGLRFSQYYECNLNSDNGFVEVILTVPRSIIFGHMLTRADTVSTTAPITGRILLRVVGDKAIFTIAPPASGSYYFTIFAKLEINSSLQSACSFAIHCDKSLPEKSCFPNMSAFGPIVSMYKFMPIPVTYKDPLITTLGEDIKIEFSLLQEFKSCHSFHLFTNNNQKSYSFDDMSNYSFLEFADTERLTFRLRCPKAGFYIFSLNAAPIMAPEPGRHATYECVFRYLIKCDNPLNSYPDRLPRACHRWFGCRLVNPYNGNLRRNEKVLFQLEAPGACDVAVMIGDAWFHLELCANLWQGQVFTGHQTNKAKVYAKLNSLKSRYSPLLEFVIP